METKAVLARKELVLPMPLADVSVVDYGDPPVSARVADEREQAAYAKGRAEAEAFAQKQIVEMRAEFLEIQRSVFEELSGRFDTMTQMVGERVPQLVMALVRRVWGGLEMTPDSIKNILDEMLSEFAPEGENLEVSLHPSDLAVLKENGDNASEHEYIKLIADEQLERGDCLVSSRFGMIDGRVETKLKKIEEELQ